ncbi:MAG: YfcC family protein [Clostridiales bacterium]|nr:YfcC family protein [Clostridiales bacterium]
MTEEKEMKKEEKSFATISVKSFVSVVVILVTMIAICGVLSLFVPQGHFLRNADGEIIAGTFVQTEAQGLSFWKIITAPVRVFFVEGSLTIIMICLFLLIMSGVFNLLDKTNGIKAIMNKIVKKFDKKKRLVICITILFFMLFGSLFGLFEELVTLLPFITLFMLSLGFDTMTGLGVCMLAACFGFSAAITNPFSVGIASSFAGISTLSGVWLRIIFFFITYGVVCWFIFSHIRKITKNPEKSYTYEMDKEKRQNLEFSGELTEKDNKVFKVYMVFFIVQLVALVLIASIRAISGFAIPILSVTFLVGGIISGLLVCEEKKKVFAYLGKGALSMLPAVALIALASSVNLVMTESGIIDTLMNTVINFLDGKSVFVAVLFIYLFILVLQIFIGSASAKIFLIMPILLPICQVIGLSPNLLILVYCMADGFSDMILPTNPVLLIGLSMSNISYGKWVKWTWKIQVAMLAVSLLVLFFGVQIGF